MLLFCLQQYTKEDIMLSCTSIELTRIFQLEIIISSDTEKERLSIYSYTLCLRKRNKAKNCKDDLIINLNVPLFYYYTINSIK